MFLRNKSTISLIILALVLVVGGVWFGRKPAPQNPPVASDNREQAVDSTKNPLGNDEVDISDDKNAIEVIKVDEVNYKSGDWMIYKNTRFGYHIALPNDFKNYSEYDGSEQEFGPDHYGFNAGNNRKMVISSFGDKRFVLYQGRDEVTDDWQKLVNGVDNKFYQIGSNKFVKRSNFTDEKYFNIANDKYMISFEFTNIDKYLKAQILNSFEFTE